MTAAETLPQLNTATRRRIGAVRWPLTLDCTVALGLLGMSLAFYYPLVFLGRVLVDYDAFVYFYPQRVYLAQSLMAGRIPLWDPNLFLGVPFLANPQAAVLYPPSWLFLLGPVETVYTVQLVLHAFLAALFTYLLARHAFGALPLAAAIGGLAYAFGGFAVGQGGHLNQISAAAWLPAVVLAYDRFAVTRHVYWLGLGALALGLQLLAGHPQETYMTLLVLGIFGIVRAPWRNVRWLAWCTVGGGLMCALGASVAAAQLLPTLELAPLSIRGDGVEWRDAVAGSLPSYLAVRALLPPFWLRVPYTEYLGYVGVTPLVLAFLALLGGRPRAVLFAAVIAFLGLFLALGENNALYGLVFASVPGFDTFRVPARWLLIWEFGVALLAALGADWIGRGTHFSKRQWRAWLRALLVLGVLGFGLTWQLQQGEPFPQRRTPLAFGAIAVATLAVSALPRLGRPLLAVGVLALLSATELWAVAEASPERQAPPPAYTQGETVTWLRAHGVTDQDRLLSLARPEYVPAAEPAVRAELARLPDPLVDAVLVAQKWRDTLTPNLPLQYGLNTADGYDGGVLPLSRWLRLSTLLVPSPRPDGVLLTRLESLPTDQMLDLLGVRYLIANAETVGRATMEATDFGDLLLFTRATHVSRAEVVFNASSAPDDSAALDRMARQDFDSMREVVLATASVATGLTNAEPLIVQPYQVSAESFSAHVSLTQPGYLLQREAWYPGWRARIDGVESTVLRADVLYRAVALATGEHDIEIFFDSPSFNRGVWVSLGGLLAVIVLMTWRWLPIMRTRVKG